MQGTAGGLADEIGDVDDEAARQPVGRYQRIVDERLLDQLAARDHVAQDRDFGHRRHLSAERQLRGRRSARQ